MLKLITAPSELITLEDAAEFMRAEFSASEEDLINTLITAARQMCEDYLDLAIGIQTLELYIDILPSNNLILLRGPIININSVKYSDADGIEKILSDEDYLLTDEGIIPILACANAIRIEYEAGYCEGGSPLLSEILPKTIKIAMLMQIADMYENREAQVERPLTANPTVERLLSTYRRNMGI